MEKLTILTRRVSLAYALLKKARNMLRFLRAFAKGGIIDFDYIRYGGHVAVTRSLVHGLRELGTSFNYNPVSVSAIGDVVVVLSGVGAVRQAIELKKQGKIKKLFVGPNVVEMSTEYDNLLAAPEIDACLVPSDMTVAIYERLTPALRGRCVSWYAGVGEKYWSPLEHVSIAKNVAVYWKNAPKPFCMEVERLLTVHGYTPLRIVYGRYNKKEFRRKLRMSAFSVFLSITETQGIALAESWAVNVPTLAWDPQIEHYYIRGLQTTAAPYLTDATGLRWKELGEFEAAIKNFFAGGFQPRAWVMEHMTDRVSAEQLVQLCKATPDTKTL